MFSSHRERNQEATVYVGNIDDNVTEAVIWELMVQAGPVVDVHLPKDRVTMTHQGFGFCEFATEDDAEYATKILNMVKLYGKPLRVNKASADKRHMEVGATIFIGNLDPEVDEKILFDAFSAFGVIVQAPKINRDADSGSSKGFAFIGYDTFEASDAAIAAMNNQFLMNRPMNVSYAMKKDGKGERHGSEAERKLAEARKKIMGNGSSGGSMGAGMAAWGMQPPPSQPWGGQQQQYYGGGGAPGW
ncbi:hypothetical protein BC828DRAFT_392800 [Blastocladiella britannica]|nr:hypothetical protein BC828DRAFT_392800 [Blastocladiella britannica]